MVTEFEKLERWKLEQSQVGLFSADFIYRK